MRAVETKPDVIILEIALPHEDGLVVLQSLHEWNLTPVLVAFRSTPALAGQPNLTCCPPGWNLV